MFRFTNMGFTTIFITGLYINLIIYISLHCKNSLIGLYVNLIIDHCTVNIYKENLKYRNQIFSGLSALEKNLCQKILFNPTFYFTVYQQLTIIYFISYKQETRRKMKIKWKNWKGNL